MSVRTAGHVVWAVMVAVVADAFAATGKSEEKSAALAWRDAGISRERIEEDWLRSDALRRFDGAAQQPAPSATPEQDAAGAVDGVKNGKWGFHTGTDNTPWWQVDLGKAAALDRVVLYNRCDFAPERTARIRVLVSDDGKTFRQVYQHNGTVFQGQPDSKPLVVSLSGATARHLRLQLPDPGYLYLDEVEVYASGGKENIALGKAATQSSVSPWSVRHGAATVSVQVREYPTARIIERGKKLAEQLRTLGVKTDAESGTLDALAKKLASLPASTDAQAQKRVYLDAHWAVRALALKNPLLDFDTLVFSKGAAGRFPHISDQHYGWWSRPGGGIYLLKGLHADTPQIACLTTNWPAGNFTHPELSYDGKKILFSYCRFYPEVPELRNKTDTDKIPEEAFYHLFEMNVDGSGLRQLTRGRYDDFDGTYLPDGDILFLSTRKGVFLQSNKANASATLNADLPYSYVRCGGDNYRPVPVFTLHRMDTAGKNLRPASAFENFEWTPSVANDGRILYTRWDYIDRFNGHFFSLWATNPDGTNPQLVYGNYTVRPQAVLEARAIPGSSKLVFTASAHHSITGGSLVMLDRTKGLEDLAPLTRLTPDVQFPETEGWDGSYYVNPWPLSEEHYLVAWSNCKLPPHCRVDSSPENPPNATGIYLYDTFGNLNLLYRDPEISSASPIPVTARKRPPVIPDSIEWDKPEEGNFMVQDVYEGLKGVERGSVTSLRVIAVPPKVQPFAGNPMIGVSVEDPGKYLLGTVPVESDGSVYFRVPSGVPVLLQAVAKDGMAIQTMRSLIYVWPGQTLSCVGCHEPRETTPMRTVSNTIASKRKPSKLTPGPEGSWPLRFDKLVQPVLDKHCVSCHAPKGSDPKAAALDLTAGKSYQGLLDYGGRNLRELARERDRSVVGDCVARQSKLMAVLTTGKMRDKVKLDEESRSRLVTWMDIYAHWQGSYSDVQEKELLELKARMSALLQVN
ncbi:MAG: discoidin domain-containing protein [bacterium]